MLDTPEIMSTSGSDTTTEPTPTQTIIPSSIATSPDAANQAADEYFQLGENWMDAEEYERAIEQFNLAIELDAENALAYNSRGFAYTCR
jgi:Flp pilus assembly protein TadD